MIAAKCRRCGSAWVAQGPAGGDCGDCRFENGCTCQTPFVAADNCPTHGEAARWAADRIAALEAERDALKAAGRALLSEFHVGDGQVVCVPALVPHLKAFMRILGAPTTGGSDGGE